MNWHKARVPDVRTEYRVLRTESDFRATSREIFLLVPDIVLAAPAALLAGGRDRSIFVATDSPAVERRCKNGPVPVHLLHADHFCRSCAGVVTADSHLARGAVECDGALVVAAVDDHSA